MLINDYAWKMFWNIGNSDIITIKHLRVNQVSVLDNPQGVDKPLNKWTKSNQ